MSVSPSLPPGAPSLADVIVERTFAKPVHALIDGEMLDALTQDHGAQPPDAAAATVDVRA